MKAVVAWLRRQLAFSNSPAAWAERLAALGLFVAGAGGWWLSRDLPLDGRLVLLDLWLVVACLLLRAEIIHLLGPVFFFEILRGSRRWVHLSRTLYAALLLGSIVYVYLIEFERFAPDELNQQARMANSFFLVFFAIQMLLVGLLTPVLVAGCIAEEKERRTLEFVLATDLRGREIVLGKLAARVAGVLLLVLAGLPLLSFLQFFGGIDPDELLVAMLVSVITLVSIAVLSIASSVFWRRGRDAIIATFAVLAGYLILSGLAQAARSTNFGRANWSFGHWTIAVSDLIDAFQAGNPILQFAELVRLQEQGNSYGDALRDLIRGYALFHGIVAPAILAWAVIRLRPIALNEADGGRPRRGRRSRLPKIGSAPMRWKEVFAERGPRFHLVVRLAIAAIVLGSFIPAANIIFNYFVNADPTWRDLERIPFTDASYRTYQYPYPPIVDLQQGMNAWVRSMVAAVGVLLLLAVTVRAATSVTGERARKTLDELLTSPLTNREIIVGKWQGSLLSVRRSWMWLGAVFLLGLATGGLNLLGIAAAAFAWFAYAVFFASLGMWYTVTARNSFRAIVYTFIASFVALGGHWLFTALCCCLPMATSHAGSGDWLPAAGGFLMGLTPPVALAIVSIGSMSELFHVRNEEALAVFFGLWGPFISLAAGFILRSAAITRFAESFNRTDRRRPEQLGTLVKRVDSLAGQPGASDTKPENQSPETGNGQVNQ